MFGEIDWGQVALKGLIGGVVGGIAGGILFVVKKLSAKKAAVDERKPGPDRG